MSLSGRRRQSAAAKGRRAAKARKQDTSARPCLMPKCQRTTTRPFGYCDRCWDPSRSIPDAQ